MFSTRILAASIAAAGAFMAPPALSETAIPPMADAPPLTQDGSALHFDAVGHRFSIPFPDWLTAAERLSPDIVSLVEATYFADDKQAFIEFFPRGETLNNFTTTYAARITNEPGRSLEDYRRATIFGYSRACNPDATGVFLFGEETPDFFPALAFICGAYLDTIPELKGQGEVMVSVFRKTDAGIAVIYQEWRGPAFGTYDPATWPVTPEALEARANELQSQAVLLADAK
jgi:hypothetical protein